MAKIFNFILLIIVRILPSEFNKLIIKKITEKINETNNKQFVESFIIPFHQKLIRLETDLRKLKLESSEKENKVIKNSEYEKNHYEETFTEREHLEFQKIYQSKPRLFDESYKSKILSYLNDVKQIIELGCGQGDLIQMIKKEKPALEILGIDINSEIISGLSKENISFKCKDVLSALKETDSNSVDLVFGMNIIEQLELKYLRKTLEQVYRVLRPGGRIILETPNIQSLYVMANEYFLDLGQKHLRHPAMYSFMLSKTGFSEIKIEYLEKTIKENKLENSSELKNLKKINELIFSLGNKIILSALK